MIDTHAVYFGGDQICFFSAFWWNLNLIVNYKFDEYWERQISMFRIFGRT